MNRTCLIAALTALCVCAAHAQEADSVDTAASKAITDRIDVPGQALDANGPQFTMDSKRGHSDADARQCLQFTGNDQIHRCAEKYRPPVVRAKFVKTSQQEAQLKPADAPKLAVSKSLDSAPAASQPADAGKLAK
jgi:hypothetical protein